MPNPNYVLLSVKDPLKSAELYDQIFETKPVERQPTFVLYALPNGLKVGLWAASDMQPAPRASGGFELAFSLPDKSAVEKAYAHFKRLGLSVAQEPTPMDFGFTFVVEDPDGNRLRPFVPSERPT